jgi:hypothetical protein
MQCILIQGPQGIGNYAATTPAAVKWFGPHQRGFIVGLVVGGYGGAAIYISPLAQYLMVHFGLSGSFIGMGVLFALVVILAGQFLAWPPAGYMPPSPPGPDVKQTAITSVDWRASEMLRTWQFYGLVFLFICNNRRSCAHGQSRWREAAAIHQGSSERLDRRRVHESASSGSVPGRNSAQEQVSVVAGGQGCVEVNRCQKVEGS